MPAQLHEDAVAWLRSRGSPITTKNLNTAVAYLNENPDARPSYASQVSEETGMSSMPEGILRAFNDGEMPQLDTEADPQDRTPSRMMPARKPMMASSESMPDMETRRAGPGMKLEEKDYDTPAEHPPMGEGVSDGSTSDMAGIATIGATAAGAGLAVELANGLKNSLQSAKNDAWVRDNFAKNVQSRVENAEAKRGGRGSRDMYQVDALNEAMKQIRAGDMDGATKSLELLDLDDQKALKSILANPPAATKRAPTTLQRALMGITRR